MPRISASPNPVGVYSAKTPAPTYIRWDTEGSFNGIVFASDNGGQEQPIPGQPSGGDRRGNDLEFQAWLGHVYRLSLKRADDTNVELASTIVTTYDLRVQLAEGFSASYLPQLRPQMITHLVVQLGIDTVRIAFRTTRPTIPTTEIRDESGAWVDGRLPLLGGLRTRHEAVFGIERPLALNRKHSFRIEAFGATGNKSNPNKAVLDGEFTTGVRNIDVMFETLDMHDDGDPDPRGAGEFRLAFGAGDAETGALMGSPRFWGENAISDEDPPIDLAETINISGAPRQLWLQVIASENDVTAAPWEMGGIGFGMRPTFSGTGSSYIGSNTHQQASVTVVVDVDTDPGRWMIPFEMKTGDFPVDYVVTGHLGVHAFVGEFTAPKMTKSGRLPRSWDLLTEIGSIAGLAVAGVDERTEEVALGADGALYHRRLTPQLPPRRDGSDWTRVELPGRGTPAVVATAADALDLFDLDDCGGVLHCRIDPGRPRAAKWRKLGGNFCHVVPAIDPGRGRGAAVGVILFGIDEDGHLQVHDTRSDGRDWESLGDVPVRTVAPIAFAGAPAALLAIDSAGSLVVFARRNGRWRPQPLDGHVRGDSPAQLLSIVPMASRPQGREAASLDLVIGVMREDRQVFCRRWPGYPSGEPEPSWQELGSLQDLLLQEEVPEPKRRRGSSKGRKAGASTEL